MLKSFVLKGFSPTTPLPLQGATKTAFLPLKRLFYNVLYPLQ